MRTFKRHTAIIDENCEAVIFDMDGVITDTAEHHARAWKETLDPVLGSLSSNTPEFHLSNDYNSFFAGRSRLDGLRLFVEAKGLKIPEHRGNTRYSIETLAEDKNKRYLEYLKRKPAHVYQDAIVLIETFKALSFKLGLATASKNAHIVLEQTKLGGHFDYIADGNTIVAHGLRSKPAPDIFLFVAEKLGVPFAQCAIFEDSHETLEQANELSPGYAAGVERWGDDNEDCRRFGDLPVFSDLTKVQYNSLTPLRSVD